MLQDTTQKAVLDSHDDTESDETTFLVRFRAAVAHHHDQLALDTSELALTNSELSSRADRMARRIAIAIPDDHVVTLLLPLGARSAIAILACLIARRTFVYVHVAAPHAHLRRLIDHSGTRAILHEHSTVALMGEIAPGLTSIDVDDADTALPPGGPTLDATTHPSRILFVA